MAIEKTYAILEVKKLLTDAADYARALPEGLPEDEYYHEMAKHLFDNLETVYRLYLEPTFNDDFKIKDADLPSKEFFEKLELIDKYDEELRAVTSELELKKSNEKILVEANNKLADSYKESLAGKDDIINLLKDLVINLAKGK